MTQDVKLYIVYNSLNNAHHFHVDITLVHILAMPFERYLDNAVYSIRYVLLLVYLVVESYTIATGDFIDELTWLLIVLSSLPLCCSAFANY